MLEILKFPVWGKYVQILQDYKQKAQQKHKKHEKLNMSWGVNYWIYLENMHLALHCKANAKNTN